MTNLTQFLEYFLLPQLIIITALIMLNMLDLTVGLTNLTLCLPMTLVKAWHLSRSRKYNIQQVQRKLQSIEENHDDDEENIEIEIPHGSHPGVVETISAAITQTLNPSNMKLSSDNLPRKINGKTCGKLVHDFEDRINQQFLENQKQFHKSSESLTKIPNPSTQVFRHLSDDIKPSSVASKIKILEPTFNGHHAEDETFDNKRMSVVERVKSLEDKFGSKPREEHDVEKIDKKTVEVVVKDLKSHFTRQSSNRTKADIQQLSALMKTQSNIISSSNDRLDRIELNFEKVIKYFSFNIF